MDALIVYPDIADWQLNPAGEASIHLSILLNGTRVAFPSLKRKIPPNFWDKKQHRAKQGYPNAQHLNDIIAGERNRVEGLLMEAQKKAGKLTKELVKSVLSGSKSDSVLRYFNEVIEDMKRERRSNDAATQKYSENYIKKWKGYRNRLEEYDAGVTFRGIDLRWLRDYEHHNGLTQDINTSLPVIMSKFLQLLRRADADGLFDMRTINKYKPPKYVNPERPYLTLDQTETIATKLYAGEFDYDPALRMVAAYFLVECWAGIRFSDWPRFSVERLVENDSLKVAGALKNREPIYIPLHNSPRLRAIINYIRNNDLKFTYTEQHTNRVLKTLTGLCKLPFKLTTHVGRHTCATLLLELGYSEETISHWLGISAEVVRVYAKFTRRKIMKEYDTYGGL